MISKKKVKELAQERIDELGKGLFIVDISISSNNSIRIELESEQGNVAIEDCVSVSRNVEHNLDREEQDFELHVSSAGLDKPFRVVQQYIKNIGRPVAVSPLEGKKIEGELVAADSNSFTLRTSRKERVEGRKKKETIIEDIVFDYNDIKETKIIITFK